MRKLDPTKKITLKMPQMSTLLQKMKQINVEIALIERNTLKEKNFIEDVKRTMKVLRQKQNYYIHELEKKSKLIKTLKKYD